MGWQSSSLNTREAAIKQFRPIISSNATKVGQFSAYGFISEFINEFSDYSLVYGHIQTSDHYQCNYSFKFVVLIILFKLCVIVSRYCRLPKKLRACKGPHNVLYFTCVCEINN